MKTNNKIIAKFMNYANNKPLTDSLLLTLYKDWESIMKVVEKIESLGYSVNISSSMVYINGDNSRIVSPLNIGFKITKIEAVYNACVEFIKWYNENSAKEK